MLWLSTTEIGSTKTFDTTVTQYQTAGLFTEPILRLLYKDHTHSLSEQKAAHLSAPPTPPPHSHLNWLHMKYSCCFSGAY